MRIVSLNTWKNEGRYRRRLDLMAEGLGELAPDVVCLQECFRADGFDTARHLANALRMDAAVEPARHKFRNHEGRRIESTSGLAILRHEGTFASGRLDLPSDPADGERIGQWADAAPGLRVLNLHLTHLRGPEAARLRSAQLACAIRDARQPHAGLLVAGDLNAAAHAPELALIAGALDPQASPTLQGARAGESPMGAAAIDHLALVSPGGWKIANRFRALDLPDADGWFASDHAAVVIDLVRA